MGRLREVLASRLMFKDSRIATHEWDRSSSSSKPPMMHMAPWNLRGQVELVLRDCELFGGVNNIGAHFRGVSRARNDFRQAWRMRLRRWCTLLLPKLKLAHAMNGI